MKVTTFIVSDDEDPEETKVHYAVILQEEEYEDDDDVPGFTTHEYAPTEWQARVDVQPWDPHESNFFRIQ